MLRTLSNLLRMLKLGKILRRCKNLVKSPVNLENWSSLPRALKLDQIFCKVLKRGRKSWSSVPRVLKLGQISRAY